MNSFPGGHIEFPQYALARSQNVDGRPRQVDRPLAHLRLKAPEIHLLHPVQGSCPSAPGAH